MIEQELNQHCEDLQQLDIEQLRSLADQVDALTKDNIEWMEHSVVLTKERDALRENRHAREDVISGLRDEVEALKTERDALQDAVTGLRTERDLHAASAVTMAVAQKEERDVLKAENAGWLKSCETLMTQRDALQKAAKLALDALELIRREVKAWGHGDDVIEALKKAGVK